MYGRWRLAAIVLIALTGSFSAATTAHAAPWYYTKGTVSGLSSDCCLYGPAFGANNESAAQFQPHGDRLWVLDKASDGRRVGVHWQLEDGTGVLATGLCWHNGGDNKWGSCGYSWMPEGKWLIFRAGSCNANNSDCSKVGNWRWGTWYTEPAIT